MIEDHNDVPLRTGESQLDKMCRAHHEVRVRQGLSHIHWEALDLLAKARARDAMKAALRADL